MLLGFLVVEAKLSWQIERPEHCGLHDNARMHSQSIRREHMGKVRFCARDSLKLHKLLNLQLLLLSISLV